MSIALLKNVFSNLSSEGAWSIMLLQYKKSRQEMQYVCRQIRLAPSGMLQNFLQEVSAHYLKEKDGELLKYSDCIDYDAEAVATKVYKLDVNDKLISGEYERLMSAISNADKELDPFRMDANAYLLSGKVVFENDEHTVKLVSLRSPYTVLRNKWRFNDKGEFVNAEEKLLTLRKVFDVVVVDDKVYFMDMDGEKLFDIERSYKTRCRETLEIICQCGIITDSEAFCAVAGTGFNPRRFITYDQKRLERLKRKAFRKKAARKFNLILDSDENIDTSNPQTSEHLVKLLCKKGMVDYFDDDAPVEVSGATKWT